MEHRDNGYDRTSMGKLTCQIVLIETRKQRVGNVLTGRMMESFYVDSQPTRGLPSSQLLLNSQP